MGINSDKATLFIGNSSGAGRTGHIGIGDVTDPQAKLHIKADENELASLFIESFAFTGGQSAKLMLGTIDYGVAAGYNKLYFNTGGNYIFNSDDANVGIGVLVPNEKLEVEGNIKITDPNFGVILQSPNGQCWKTTVNDSSELTTQAVNCETAVGENTKETTEHFIIFPNPTHSNIIIEYGGEQINYVVNIYNMAGILVHADKIKPGKTRLNLKQLSGGEYIVNIISPIGNLLKTEKVIKR